MNDAAKCKRMGWKVGTRLVGNEGYGDTVIKITAIGERLILAKQISHEGKPADEHEGTWTLSYRAWKKV